MRLLGVGRRMTGMHSDAEIEVLEDTLHNINLLPCSMMPSEFDGLVAAVLLCPEPVSPNEWVPLVLGDDEDLVGLDASEAQAILDVLVAHYNRVARNFLEKKLPYEAMIAFEGDDDVFWEMWVDGFSAGMNLKPDAFDVYAQAQTGHAAEAFASLQMLADFTQGDLDLPDEEWMAIIDSAPELIPSIVVHMYLWLEEHTAPNCPLKDLAWEDIKMSLHCKTRH